MTVHFIGAGPGAADLITVRGRDLIRRSPVVLYAGSLVPPEIVAEAGAEKPRSLSTNDLRVIASQIALPGLSKTVSAPLSHAWALG